MQTANSGLFTGLACLGDILLLRGWLIGQLAMIEVIFLHSFLSIALGGLAILLHRRLTQLVVVRVLILLLFGPLGGPALMIAAPGVLAARPRAAVESADAASQTMSAGRADDLFQQIRQGRRHPLAEEPAFGFLEIFREGTFQQQQEAISAISRGYQPEMRPALSAALASPIPALRVQAAAVYAKLRGTYETRAKELLAQDKSGVLLLCPDLLTECANVAQSGFVDAETKRLLLECCRGPAELAATRLPLLDQKLQTDGRTTVLARAPRLGRYSCGGLA